MARASAMGSIQCSRGRWIRASSGVHRRTGDLPLSDAPDAFDRQGKLVQAHIRRNPARRLDRQTGPDSSRRESWSLAWRHPRLPPIQASGSNGPPTRVNVLQSRRYPRPFTAKVPQWKAGTTAWRKIGRTLIRPSENGGMRPISESFFARSRKTLTPAREPRPSSRKLWRSRLQQRRPLEISQPPPPAPIIGRSGCSTAFVTHSMCTDSGEANSRPAQKLCVFIGPSQEISAKITGSDRNYQVSDSGPTGPQRPGTTANQWEVTKHLLLPSL